MADGATTPRPPQEAGRLPRALTGTAQTSWAKSRWHALGARPFPPRTAFGKDLRGLIREWIVPEQLANLGVLSRDDTVVTLGSCFARELRSYLEETGFASKNFWIPSGLNNTFAILDFVSWCVTGSETGRGFRYDRSGTEEIEEWTPTAEREQYLENLREAGAFVFTLGLAEVWEERDTGGVFWRGVPEEIFDDERHEFRLSSVQENEDNIVRIVELIRSVNETAPIVLTLSPVPLAATFSDTTCMIADTVSKSVLRVAIDNAMRRELPGVYYWPSFEIVRWVGPHVPWRMYGADANARHVARYVVAEIIDAFVDSFFTPEAAQALRRRRKQESPPWTMRGRLVEASVPLRKKRRKLQRLSPKLRKQSRKLVRRVLSARP